MSSRRAVRAGRAAEADADLPLLEVVLPPAGDGYPFDLPALRGLDRLRFTTPVTLLVGENGSGKSMLLEALALTAELPSAGHEELARDATLAAVRPLAEALRPVWSARSRRGLFFRAEDFFAYQRRLDAMRAELRLDAERVGQEKAGQGAAEVARAQAPYTGQAAAITASVGEDAHGRSHGEAFLAFFRGRLTRPGLFLLDEVEAALSPTRQLAFLSLLKEAVAAGAQVVMATHSPLLLAYPGAMIWSFDRRPLQPVEFEDLEHVQLTRSFLADPEAFLRHL